MKKNYWFLLFLLFFHLSYSQFNKNNDTYKEKDLLTISKNKKKYGVINSVNQNVVIPFEYDKIIPLNNEGFALESNKEWIVTDNKGDFLSSAKFKKITIPENLPQNESKKIIAVGVNSENKNITLFIKNHNQYYNQTYKNIKAFPPYYYSVTQDNEKYGIITFRGEEVIPMQYESIELITNSKGESFAKVVENKKFGCINLSNRELIISVIWNNLGLLTDNTFWVEKESFNSGIINRKGGYILPANDKRNFTVFSEKLIRVEEKNSKKVFYISIDDPTFNNEINIPSLDSLFVKNEKTKYGVIDNNKNIIIPFEYDKIEKTNQGVFIVTKNLKNKLIDHTGKEVTSEYEKIIYDSITDNFTAKFEDKKWSIINYKGEMMLDNKFSSQKDLSKYLNKDLYKSNSNNTAVKVLKTTANIVLYTGFILLDLILLND